MPLERYLETTGAANTAGQRFLLDPLPAVIGRQPGARVQIGAAGVSRLHAEIDLAPGGNLRIRDLGSTKSSAPRPCCTAT